MKVNMQEIWVVGHTHGSGTLAYTGGLLQTQRLLLVGQHTDQGRDHRLQHTSHAWIQHRYTGNIMTLSKLE